MKFTIPVRATAAVVVMLVALHATAACDNPPLRNVTIQPHDDEGKSTAYISTEDVHNVQTFWDGELRTSATPSEYPNYQTWPHNLNRFCMATVARGMMVRSNRGSATAGGR